MPDIVLKDLTEKLVECQAENTRLSNQLASAVYEITGSEDEATRVSYLQADHTAFDEAIKQAKREALLEAADVFEILGGATCKQLRGMAEEIK